jgi:parallel beta-helix repeat protein
MNNKIAVIWISLAMLFSFTVIIVEIPLKVTAYTPHDPISIDGDADFASQAASEGWPGDGTEGNPYIIEGYEINASSTHGIEIKSTTYSFIIWNSSIKDGEKIFYGNYGIFLYNVTDGKIENCTIKNNRIGIFLDQTKKIIINDNKIQNNYYGINIDFSIDTSIKFNNLEESDTAIYSIDAIDNNITGNNVSNSELGIYFKESYQSYIANNNVFTDDYGIYLSESNQNNICNNSILGSMNGIALIECSGNILKNNRLHECGISILGSI